MAASGPALVLFGGADYNDDSGGDDDDDVNRCLDKGNGSREAQRAEMRRPAASYARQKW